MLGGIAFLIELHYWKDLTISGYLWIFFKPLLYFITTLFLLSNGAEVDSFSFWNSYFWVIFWFSCLNVVQSTRRLRRFFKFGSFKIKDIIAYAIIEYLIISLVLLALFSPLAFYLGFDSFSLGKYILISFFFLASIILLIYIGSLSVNALDVSYIFVFLPFVFLLLLINSNFSKLLLGIFPQFYFIVNRDFDLMYILIVASVMLTLSIPIYIYLRKNYKLIYMNSIA
jgi:hypothetical protein